MIELAFVVLYGLAFIGGIFLSAVWGRVAWRARCITRPGPMDQFCLIAIGLCIGALSNVMIFGTRTVSGLMYGVDPAVTHQPWSLLVLAGLVVMGISKWILMWAHDTSHRSRAWRWFAILSAAWIIAAPIWIWGLMQ